MPNGSPHTIRRELSEHLPFTLLGAATGILLLWILNLLTTQSPLGEQLGRDSETYEHAFHIFHGFHLLFSAVASTAIYYRYRPSSWRAALVGTLVTIPICGLSDILIPFIGGFLLGSTMQFHFCVVEEPGLVFSFTVFGIVAGLIGGKTIEKTSYFSHGAHVLISSFASLFYLVSFGLTQWFPHIGGVFIVTVLAVIIPCCLSDVVLPLSLTHEGHSRE